MTSTRWGIKLSPELFSQLEEIELVLDRREHNLGGAAFERAMIRRFPKLHAVPHPIPPQLESFYSRGTARRAEPIVDAFFRSRSSSFLVEIKKGFHRSDRTPCIATSREQLQVLVAGTTVEGGGGVAYGPGEYWIFVPHRMSSARTKTVKYSLYRALPGLVDHMHTFQDQLGVTLTSHV